MHTEQQKESDHTTRSRPPPYYTRSLKITLRLTLSLASVEIQQILPPSPPHPTSARCLTMDQDDTCCFASNARSSASGWSSATPTVPFRNIKIRRHTDIPCIQGIISAAKYLFPAVTRATERSPGVESHVTHAPPFPRLDPVAHGRRAFHMCHWYRDIRSLPPNLCQRDVVSPFTATPGVAFAVVFRPPFCLLTIE